MYTCLLLISTSANQKIVHATLLQAHLQPCQTSHLQAFCHTHCKHAPQNDHRTPQPQRANSIQKKATGHNENPNPTANCNCQLQLDVEFAYAELRVAVAVSETALSGKEERGEGKFHVRVWRAGTAWSWSSFTLP
jgi:hypothetical protein